MHDDLYDTEGASARDASHDAARASDDAATTALDMDIEDDAADASSDAGECPICFARMSAPPSAGAAPETSSAIVTSCGHRFCAECLRAATRRSSKCPLCRGQAHRCEEKDDACAMCRVGIVARKDAAAIVDAARRRDARSPRFVSALCLLASVPCTFVFWCTAYVNEPNESDFGLCPEIGPADLGIVAIALGAVVVLARACVVGERARVWESYGTARALRVATVAPLDESPGVSPAPPRRPSPRLGDLAAVV